MELRFESEEIALSITGGLGLMDDTLEEHVEWWLQGHGYSSGDYRDLLEWLTAEDSTLAQMVNRGLWGPPQRMLPAKPIHSVH